MINGPSVKGQDARMCVCIRMLSQGLKVKKKSQVKCATLNPSMSPLQGNGWERGVKGHSTTNSKLLCLCYYYNLLCVLPEIHVATRLLQQSIIFKETDFLGYSSFLHYVHTHTCTRMLLNKPCCYY